VKTLASILRVAESLDRSHSQVVSGLELRDRGEDALLQLHTESDAELEVWATNRYLKPFEEMIGKPVRLEVARHASPNGGEPGPPAAAPRPRRRAKRSGAKDRTKSRSSSDGQKPPARHEGVT
jgi:hypothetical protein